MVRSTAAIKTHRLMFKGSAHILWRSLNSLVFSSIRNTEIKQKHVTHGVID